MVNLLSDNSTKKITLAWSVFPFPVEETYFSSGAHLFCSSQEKSPVLVNGYQVGKKELDQKTGGIPNIVAPNNEGIFSSANYLLKGFESD